ncbi:MAG: hypothetical protein WA613_00730 [Candidatus Acidiferrales bacterium]
MVMVPDVPPSIDRVLEMLQKPFWHRIDFWISTVLGSGGLIFSILAYREATEAKRAAIAAGRTVKIQTVAIELTEVSLKLDRIEPKIRFSEARDLLAEISRRLHRATSPFVDDPKLSNSVSATLAALAAAQTALKAVRPTDPAKEDEAPFATYNAIEDNFATINNCVGDLVGLLEKESSHFGEEDAES